MSRFSEIVEKLNNLTRGTDYSPHPQPEKLWKRFEKVSIVVKTLMDKPDEGIPKSIKSLRWGGVDTDIIDHYGS